VQVEREPCDVGVELAPGLLDRRLAEPAERSDVVAPDDDRVLGHVSLSLLPRAADANLTSGRRRAF
jgi:hypothetical protein